MLNDPVRLPRRFVVAIAILCMLPMAMNLLGIRFELHRPTDLEGYPRNVQEYYNSAYFTLRGMLVHTLLEWTSCCLAIVTAFFTFFHYTIKKDVATPIIGTALLFSGLLDAFHVLAADQLIIFVSDTDYFVPFTWAISRIFHAVILTIGTGMLVWRSPDRGLPKHRGVRHIVLVSIFYGLLAYLLIQICAVTPDLPQTIFPGARIPRPYDAIALIVYLFGGGVVFPRFHRRHPSYFSHGLMVSLVPYLLSQSYAAFASDAQYDNALNISQYLKIIALLVPLAGLLCDYTQAFQAEATLRATEEKLRIAREIQRGLLPQGPPNIPGFAVAGFSSSAGAVGGDYYDYLSIQQGSWGLVIADVSGHDLGASLLMSQTRAYLRAVASGFNAADKIVSRLNQFLMHDVRDRRFVSLFFAHLDPKQKVMRYVAAGQNGHLFRADGRVKTLEVTGPLLGVIDEPQTMSGEFTIKVGEMILLFTDGIAEATSPRGEQFGNDRIFQIVRRYADQPPAEILQEIEKAAIEFRGNRPIDDDVTILMLKRLT